MRAVAGSTLRFVVEAPDAGIEVEALRDAAPKVVKSTPTQAGLYPFCCGKKMIFMSSHRDKGMHGVLAVR